MSQTTPIEECDFAFKCPMMLENLKLVEPAIAGGAGPVFFCDQCNKNVYTVRTQAEKQQCALDRKCVVFNRHSTHPSANSRYRVALVTDDETEADILAAPAKVKKALAEIRAIADFDSSPSTVSVIDRLIVEFTHQGSYRKTKAVSEFRHVPKSQLIDISVPGHVISSTVTNPTTGKKERPFVPDIIMYLDDPGRPPNFSGGGTALAIRLGETGATASYLSDFNGTVREPVPTPVVFGDGSPRLDLSIVCDPTNGEWLVGDTEAVRYGKIRRGSLYTFDDFTMFMMFPASSLKTDESKGFYSAVDCFNKYLQLHPQMDLRNRKAGESGIFLRPKMEKPSLSTCGNIRPTTSSLEMNVELLVDDGAAFSSFEEYPVFEAFDFNGERAGEPVNFFFLASQMFRFIKNSAGSRDGRIEKFISNSSRSISLAENGNSNSTNKNNNNQIHVPTIYHSLLPAFINIPFAPGLSPFSVLQGNNINNNNDSVTSSAATTMSRAQIAQNLLYYTNDSSTADTRFKEVFMSVGLAWKTAVKKDSSMSLIGMGCTEEHTSGAEVPLVQIRFGGASTTLETFIIEDGILESFDVKFLDNFSGRRLDQILFDYVLENHVKNAEFRDKVRDHPVARNRLLAACESARIRLSTLTSTSIELEALVPGHSEFDLECKLSRPKLDSIFENEYRRLAHDIRDILGRSNSSHSYGRMSTPEQVLRVGVSGFLAATPRIISLLESLFPNVSTIYNCNYHTTRQLSAADSSSSMTPDSSSSSSNLFKFHPGCIACNGHLVLAKRRGLFGGSSPPKNSIFKSGYTCGMSAVQAVEAAAKKEDESSSMLLGMLDIVVLSLGVSDATTGTMVNLIERNSMYPKRKKIMMRGRQLCSAPNNATGAMTSELRIFEGERANASDNHSIGILQFPETVNPESDIEITFDLDANGILVVSATDSMNDGNTVSVVITNDKGRLSAAEIEQMVRDAERWKYQDNILQQKVEKKNKIESSAYLIRNFLKESSKSTSATSWKKNSSNGNDDEVDSISASTHGLSSFTLSDENRAKLGNLCQEAIDWTFKLTSKVDETPLEEFTKYLSNFEIKVAEIVNPGNVFLSSLTSGEGMPQHNNLGDILEKRARGETVQTRPGLTVEEVD